MKPFLEAGEFVKTHGINGELRLYPWCDEPSFLSNFKILYLDENGNNSIKITLLRPHKNICITKLQGIDSVDAARPFIGKTVYIARKHAILPSGMHFVQDLLGATVSHADTGELFGKIKAITKPCYHNVYEIEKPNGKLALFPAVEPFLVSVDVENASILVRPIPGMFDDEEKLQKKAKPKKYGKKVDKNDLH